MLAGARRARPRAREADSRSGGSRRRSRSPSRGPRSSSTSRTTWLFARSAFLHHALGWRSSSARSSRWCASAGRARSRSRRLRAALPRRSRCCSSPTATWRRSSATSRRTRERRTVRRLALVAARSCALAVPAAALAHATLERPRPASAAARAVAEVVRSASTRPCRCCRRSRPRRERRESPARPSRASGLDVVAPVRTLPRGAYTVRWHAISADGHVVSGVFTFGVRVTAPPPTAAFGAGADAHRARRPLARTSSRSRSLIGGLGFRLLVLRGPAAAARSTAPLPRHGHRRVGVLEVGIARVPPARRGCAAAAVRAAALRRPRRRSRAARASATPSRDGARLRVRHRISLPRLAADRTWLLWPAFLLGIGFASGLSLSGHARSTGLVVVAELADWVHLAAASLWVGGLVRSSPSCGRRRRSCAAGVPALLALATVLVGPCSRRGST